MAQYLMNKLMNCAELEAFAAQKKAGSNSAYFALLEEFTEIAPNILASLITAPASDEEQESFQKRILALQKRLLSIGSPALLWLTEKVASSAQCGNRAKCEDDLYILSSRVKALCVQLDEAKTDSSLRVVPRTPVAAPPPPPQAKTLNRPQAPAKPELFEKLNILIENFEFDDVIAMLRSLLAFTYSPAIDFELISIYKDLTRFDYDGASVHAKKLLKLTKERESEGTSAKKKILAVDDVPDVLNSVKSLLKKDYAVYGVTNHMAALKFLTSNTADLILLDIEMPDMDGFSLLSIIRKIKVYENTPVFFLTGNVNVDNIKKACNAGANDFIKKPVNAQLLLEKIAHHLA